MLREGTYIADRYEIVARAGTGGMAEVYKAKDHVLGRFVGIKVLKQEFSEDVNFVTKFRTEAQSAAGLEHPNIVNIYDVGSENSMHYIVMEYVEGITLKSYIAKKGQLSFKEAVSIAIQVGRGIEAAHNKHIIHRDIKPQNIIISTEGKVKVTDFGIARVANSNTINADVMGSVHYSSPEQARNGFVDGKSDIYSLGIVMYEMVTGRVPFDGESTVAIAIQHLQEEMIVPSAYAPNLPISMEKIILKCTQKSPDRRYGSIGDMLLDLKKSLISPDEDFVVMVPLGQKQDTKVVKQEEVETIKNQARDMYVRQKKEEEEPEDTDDEDEDEEDDGFLNPKMEKAVTIMGIVAAIIIVIIIAYIGGSFFGLFKFGGSREEEPKEPLDQTVQEEEESDKVEMIDVRNMTFEEARKALNAISLGIDRGGEESSEEYEKGRIISQSQEKGTMLEKNTTIEVVISSGVGEFPIPDVRGLDRVSAEARIVQEGFVASFDYEYNDTVPNEQVIRQTPDVGTKAKKGETIHVMLSRGVQPVQMINVLNKPESQAKDELAALGLGVNVDSDYHDEIPQGHVISQSIEEGKLVERGTTVNLLVSLGKRITTYSLVDYNIEVLEEIPEDAVSVRADIVLFKMNGDEVIGSWTATQFPFPISQGNIEGASEGYFVIDWEWSYEDEDGAIINQKTQQTIGNVPFTQD